MFDCLLAFLQVPSCAEGCPASWINDGFCDATCNNAQCNLDGGDCANKTSGFDMDDEEDDFRLRNSLPSGTCHPGCLNGWLADRYCDTVCNHAQCAFDAGDCGLDKLAKYPHFLVDKQATMPVYKVPPGERVAVFNTSTIFADRNGTLKEGVFKQAKGIRVVAVHPQRQAIVLLLHPNTTGSSLFTITFAVPEEKTIGYEFKVEFDSSETQDEVTDQETSTFSRTLQTFATVPSELKRPKPRFDVVSKEEVRLAWSKSSLALDDLQRLKVAGQLTEYGFERRRAALLGLPVNTSITVITRTRNTEVITAPITTVSPTSTGMKKIKDEITRRNNQKNKVTTRKMSAHQYKDAYADSLRHVNRLYNDVFGIEARKVPAHVPHLVDKSVMEELQRKLPAEFDKTSATRVRSASDMQFAFSYFYYMMSVKQDVAMGQIFDEMDTDKSATWDEREVYLAALRSMGESDVDSEKQSKRLRQAVINCTSQPLSQKRLAISKKEIMACDKVKEIMLPTWNSRKKFRFKTNAESTEFTFVRVSNNLTMLHKELEGILRKPKKYICINDEVDYTREDADVIQSTTRQFFQLLFPRPSSFELPPNRRNNFRYISEFRQWEKTSGMYRRLLIIGFVLALLTFFWFIFPQRRRKMCRKVRQWVAAPRHHVDFAQRFVIDA
ncbi:hypothetical protein RvY_11128-2 [Ramazzottius varieornatus]|nr:hypothetical protein RvY_11128-2 [Ramazzottius varieornatus]